MPTLQEFTAKVIKLAKTSPHVNVINKHHPSGSCDGHLVRNKASNGKTKFCLEICGYSITPSTAHLVEKFCSDETQNSYARLLHNAAVDLYDANCYSGAESLLREAVTLVESDYEEQLMSQFLLAKTLERQGKLQSAVQQYEDVAELSLELEDPDLYPSVAPNAVLSLFKIVADLQQVLANYEASIEWLKRALDEKYSSDCLTRVRLFCDLGTCYLKLERFSDAYSECLRANRELTLMQMKDGHSPDSWMAKASIMILEGLVKCKNDPYQNKDGQELFEHAILLLPRTDGQMSELLKFRALCYLERFEEAFELVQGSKQAGREFAEFGDLVVQVYTFMYLRNTSKRIAMQALQHALLFFGPLHPVADECRARIVGRDDVERSTNNNIDLVAVTYRDFRDKMEPNDVRIMEYCVEDSIVTVTKMNDGNANILLLESILATVKERYLPLIQDLRGSNSPQVAAVKELLLELVSRVSEYSILQGMRTNNKQTAIDAFTKAVDTWVQSGFTETAMLASARMIRGTYIVSTNIMPLDEAEKEFVRAYDTLEMCSPPNSKIPSVLELCCLMNLTTLYCTNGQTKRAKQIVAALPTVTVALPEGHSMEAAIIANIRFMISFNEGDTTKASYHLSVALDRLATLSKEKAADTDNIASSNYISSQTLEVECCLNYVVLNQGNIGKDKLMKYMDRAKVALNGDNGGVCMYDELVRESLEELWDTMHDIVSAIG